MEKMKYTQIRHGDVFLRKVDGLPGNAVQQGQRGPTVVQYGEVTGHAHRLTDAVMWSAGAQRYVEVKARTTITHEEHGTIEVPEGVYEVLIERDYDPSLYFRTVVD